jgi:IstB-like ATP binding protein
MEVQLGKTDWLACDRIPWRMPKSRPTSSVQTGLGFLVLWKTDHASRVYAFKTRPSFKAISEIRFNEQGPDGLMVGLLALAHDRACEGELAHAIDANLDAGCPDQAMTLAAIDRLVHHSTILEMNVESYRRRAALDRKRKGGTDTPTPVNKRTSGLPTGSPSRNEAHLTPIDDQMAFVEGDRAVQKVLANRKTQGDHNAATGRRFTP